MKEQSKDKKTDNRKKVLIAESNSVLATILKQRLINEGYKAYIAKDGEEALFKTAKYKPDLIITCILLPKVSGFDLIDVLSNTPELRNIPIVVCSALDKPTDISRAKQLGAVDYLVKSEVTVADVFNAVNKHIHDSPSTHIKEEQASENPKRKSRLVGYIKSLDSDDWFSLALGGAFCVGIALLILFHWALPTYKYNNANVAEKCQIDATKKSRSTSEEYVCNENNEVKSKKEIAEAKRQAELAKLSPQKRCEAEHKDFYDPGSGEDVYVTCNKDGSYDVRSSSDIEYEDYISSQGGAGEDCEIKGNVSYSSGERIYHVPGDSYYDETVINGEYGERWFCSEAEAQNAGWRRAR